jgi:hypothetical protein
MLGFTFTKTGLPIDPKIQYKEYGGDEGGVGINFMNCKE